MLDVKLCRRGVTRTVLLIGRWAIKVPTIRGLGDPKMKGARCASFARGVLANRSELEWSGTEGVNPVVWSWRCVINVYRRAEPVIVVDETFDFDAICPEWKIIGDRKSENIGLVDGRIVWLDFDLSWNGVRGTSADELAE